MLKNKFNMLQQTIRRLLIIDLTIKNEFSLVRKNEDDQIVLIITFKQEGVTHKYQMKNQFNMVISLDFDFQNLYLAINQAINNVVDKENLNLQQIQILTKKKNLFYQQVQKYKQIIKNLSKIEFIDQPAQFSYIKKSSQQQKSLNIPFRQELIYNNNLQQISQKFSIIIQKYFFKLAQEGQLLILKQNFLDQLYQKIKIKFPYINQNIFNKLMQEIEQYEIFQTIQRKFEDFDQIQFCGLHLKNLSLQSIYWILKSLQIDKMTPTQKIFFSRIKECFALKIDTQYQNNLIDYIIENKYFYVEKIENQNIIWIQDMKWETEDLSEFVQEDQQYNAILYTFLNQFFDKKSYNNTWISSVESVLTKASAKKPQKFIQRAIPGGKYGCIQFLKCCGPQSLQSISFGKLQKLVQHTIDNQFLVYHKTLLIRNDQQLNHNLDETSVQRINKIHTIQQKLFQILEKNIQGIPIAILPKILQKNVNFKIDLYELGFTKLKKFLYDQNYINIDSSNPNKVQILLDQQYYIKDKIYEINDFLRQLLIQSESGIPLSQIEQQVQEEFDLPIKFEFKSYSQKNNIDFINISQDNNIKFLKIKKCTIQSNQFYPQNQSFENYEQEIQNIKFINALLQDFEFDNDNDSPKQAKQPKIIIDNQTFKKSIFYNYEID